LYDAHIGDIVGDEAVKAQMKKPVAFLKLMRGKNGSAHGPFPALGRLRQTDPFRYRAFSRKPDATLDSFQYAHSVKPPK
jgi:hypothetical protein